MQEKDILEKILEDHNDVFSDIVNVLLFNGEHIVSEDALSKSDNISMLKIDGKIHEQERDISKYWNGEEIVLSEIGFENQSAPDNKMPFRVLSYDGSSYKKQMLEEKTQINPVLTLVLYFGDKKWKYPLNLKECVNIPEGTDKYINDYKINLFQIAFLEDDIIEKFTSDFKIVAKFFKNKRLGKEFMNDKQTIKHIDEMIKFLRTVTGDKRYEINVNEIPKQKGDVINMCSVAEAIENRGIKKGIEQGIEQGKIIGFEQGKVKTLLELNMSIPQIMEHTGFSEDKVNAIIESMNK